MPLDGDVTHYDREREYRRAIWRLEVAKLVLKDDGWVKGSTKNRHGRCLLGALGWTASRSLMPQENLLLDVLGFRDREEAWRWNDRSHRQLNHVLGRLDNAIVILNERCNQGRQADQPGGVSYMGCEYQAPGA